MQIDNFSLFLGGAISFTMTALFTENNEGAWSAAGINFIAVLIIALHRIRMHIKSK